ncbi:MAG: hypothetical protein ACE5HX_00325 [bacterium]
MTELRKRMLIHVRHGKGAKDCYVPLPETTLEHLRAYYRTHRNPVWIFPAAGRAGQHNEFSTATRPTPHGNIQDAFRTALRKSGVNKKARASSSTWLPTDSGWPSATNVSSASKMAR